MHKLFQHTLVAFLAVAAPALAEQAADQDPIERAVDALIAPRQAQPGPWEISAGIDYSSGKYSATRPTEVLNAPFGVSYRHGAWRFSADSGYLRVEGPVDYAAIFDFTAEEIAEFGLDEDISIASGIADTVLGARYAVFEKFDSGTFVDLGTRVPIPTASRAKGLGTGDAAVDLQLDLTQLVGDWSLLLSGSYGFRPGASRDTQSLSAGVGRPITERFSIGALYEWRRGDQHEGVVYASYDLSAKVSVTAYVVAGLSSASVGHAVGLRFSVRP